MMNDAVDTSTNITIIPYTATTYRVVYGWGTGENTIISSGVGTIGGVRMFSWQFDITCVAVL
jgi:hypothetical protein